MCYRLLMTNSEIRMTNECLMFNVQMSKKIRHLPFKNSSFIRHSDFDIRHFHAAASLVFQTHYIQNQGYPAVAEYRGSGYPLGFFHKTRQGLNHDILFAYYLIH